MSRKPERMTNAELLGVASILVQKVLDDIEESHDPVLCVAMGRIQVILWALGETEDLLGETEDLLVDAAAREFWEAVHLAAQRLAAAGTCIACGAPVGRMPS